VNLATVVSAISCAIGLLFAVLMGVVAAALGSRSVRTFALTCLLGSAYAACMMTIASSSEELARYGAHLGLLFAALHSVSWYVYTARRAGRPLHRWELMLSAIAVVISLGSLVPNAYYRTDVVWVHEIAWLGIRYTDHRSTALGNVVFGYYFVYAAILVVRALRKARRGTWVDHAEAIGLSAMLLCAVNDMFTASGTLPTPYLLDVGFLVLVVAAGTGLARGYVDNARALEATQKELVAKERLAAIGEMAAVVAHEVRNPVAIIFNASASLRKLPEEREALAAIIEEEAGRLTRLARDLLDFAKPTKTTLHDAELGAIVASAVEGVREGAVELPDVVVDGDLPTVLADAVLLRQAVLNLVANALTAPGRRGPVRIRADVREDDRVHIQVIDDGHGVPEELRSSIAQPFFTTRPTGTGLGLAFVRRIAQAHGGRLIHHETPGGGATFVIDVPRARVSIRPQKTTLSLHVADRLL